MESRAAAAVLVIQKNRVLGFLKYDKEGVSVPCGKLEEGETPRQAAVRECEEETGFSVELSDDPPYEAFDPAGGFFVSTFRANIVGEKPVSTPEEGKACWVSPRTLSEGPFAHYNERMLRHFGVNPWPLVGKFHSHLTLKGSADEVERAALLTGGKVTYIDLERSKRNQTDAMITHHYLTGARGLEDEHDVLSLLVAKAAQLRDSGISVVRVKLEYEVFGKNSPRGDVERALARLPYTEIHVKLLVAESADLAKIKESAARIGWHPSRNPFAKTEGRVVQFINRRFYDGVKIENLDAETDAVSRMAVEMGTEISEIKYETAIYDSNDDLDHWWMS